MKRAVFLDRDGVLNKAYVRNGRPYSPDTIEEMIIVPDASEALERLRQHGFRLIVATFCCGFIMVFAGLRLATSVNGINQAMPVMAAHAAPVMVSALGDQRQDLRRNPATVPIMYDLRFAVSASRHFAFSISSSAITSGSTSAMPAASLVATASN